MKPVTTLLWNGFHYIKIQSPYTKSPIGNRQLYNTRLVKQESLAWLDYNIQGSHNHFEDDLWAVDVSHSVRYLRIVHKKAYQYLHYAVLKM